ncbi:Tail Collar domain protein [Vibrio ichthyoenteri ATCC 700023]|uniref:Tail Collar domain protein n=1 Tax=Vibrio ichthyoenteri ATCC 700023 TaxID=870968 RepID=F9S0Z5_9VIBR|nr:tail fiber protein [Vibrio ichthyoenteri]EGU42978.1 Tail Collar domain protein [Vibrio ichthyoenteri ATCC 700023]
MSQPLMVLNTPVVSAASGSAGALIGAPVYWPLASVPKGYLPMIGQAFDKAAYPELAKVYPSGVLPDSRDDYFRVAGDGVEPLTRQAQSVQPLGFASDPHAHSYGAVNFGEYVGNGSHKPVGVNAGGRATNSVTVTGRITGTGAETRPRSLLWNCITRAE